MNKQKVKARVQVRVQVFARPEKAQDRTTLGRSRVKWQGLKLFALPEDAQTQQQRGGIVSVRNKKACALTGASA